MNRLPELFAKLEESLTLTRLDGDSVRELAPQNLILDLEVTDLASQFFVRRRAITYRMDWKMRVME